MKKLLLLSVLFFFLLGGDSFAHPGRTASDGCHYCRTNCSSWGEVYGERHCHGGYSAPSYTPSYSIPSYTAPQIPSCPSNSYYNSLSKSCTCSYGYISNGSSCVNANTSCQNDHGYGAEYNSLSKKCECSYGYTVGDNNQCITFSNYCTNELGYGGTYNSLYDKCECRSGYTYNGKTCEYETTTVDIFKTTPKETPKTTCVDTVNGYLGTDDNCYCYNDYIWSDTNNKCVKKTTKNYCASNSSLASDGICYCNEGYTADKTKTSCVKVKKVPPKTVEINKSTASAATDHQPQVKKILEAQTPIEKLKGIRSYLQSLEQPTERIKFIRLFHKLKKEQEEEK